MKSAIRLAAVLVMVGGSTAVFAGEPEATGDDRAPQQAGTEMKATSDDLGHGSGEPGKSAAQIDRDEKVATATTLREQRQKDFLNEVWRAAP